MDAQEIFTRLMQLRSKIEADTEEPMRDSDNALLYDVARTLGLSNEQTAAVCGDDKPQLVVARQYIPRHDFSHSGLGIGGLGRFQETPIIPTVEQMKRVEKLEAGATTCKRCHLDDAFDGAMFTTDRSSGFCDDCYG